MKPLLGHTEQLTYLVHRHTEHGDWWVQLPAEGDDTDVREEMQGRLIDMGGKLYEVTATATVTKSKLIDTDDDK